jgi:transposase
MARRAASEWAQLVEQWKRSGLTARDFAAQAGINPRTLTWWKWRLKAGEYGGEDPKSPSESGQGFGLVPLQVVSAEESATEESPVEVVLGGAVVRVRRNFDEQTLARVLEVVGGEDESC